MNEQQRKAMELALEALENNRQTHNYCEDTWYSCPKHEDGCANESEGDECNCGADKANAEIDKAITAIKEALAQDALQALHDENKSLGLYEPEQESVDLTLAYMAGLSRGKDLAPLKRKPLTDEQIQTAARNGQHHQIDFRAGVQFAEAAHGIKE